MCALDSTRFQLIDEASFSIEVFQFEARQVLRKGCSVRIGQDPEENGRFILDYFTRIYFNEISGRESLVFLWKVYENHTPFHCYLWVFAEL